MSAKTMLTCSYLGMMRAHVDEGGQLSHRNGLDLLAEVEHLRAASAPATGGDELRACYEHINCLEDSLGSVLCYLEGDPEYANAKPGLIEELNALLTRELASPPPAPDGTEDIR